MINTVFGLKIQYMLTIADFSAPKAFLISIFCSIAAYYVFKLFKKKKDDNFVLFLFWISCSIFYIFLGTSTLVFYFLPWLAFKIYYFCLIFAGAQIFIGMYYLIQKIINEKKTRIVIAIILAIIFIIYSALSIKNARPAVRYGEPYLTVGDETPQGYWGAILILVIISFSLFSFRRDFKSGAIGWGLMGGFYGFYAFVIYMSISLIRILYFLVHPWYLEIFYFFIPYLAYKSYKELT